MKILITGFAVFIGFHASQEFLRRGWKVVGMPKTTIREGIPVFAKWYKEYRSL